MTKRLLLLNGLAALMVAVHHAAAYGFSAMFLWTDRYLPVEVPNYDQIGNFAYFATLTIRQVTSFAIPAFLFVSGYFVAFAAKGSSTKIGWEAIFNRIKKLIVPFIFWTAIVFILLQRFTPTLEEILLMYYYIPLICQYYLLSPFLIPLAKNRPRLLLILSAVVQLGFQAFRHLDALGVSFPGLNLLIDLSPSWFFPGHLFFFVLGLVAGLHLQGFIAWLGRAKWFLLAATLLLVPLSLLEYQVIANQTGKEWLGPAFATYARTFFSVTMVLTFLAFDKVKIPFSPQLTRLGERSLGIYLVNTPAIYVAARLMYQFTPWILGSQLLYQGILILVGLGIPLVLMNLVARPPAIKVYRYVFG